MRYALAPALLLGACVLTAQEPVHVRVGKPNWSASSSTVTAALIVTNAGDSAVRVVPAAELPPDWRLVTGNGAVNVDSAGTSLIMLGVAIPSRAPAGSYRLPVTVSVDDRVLARDTMEVTVPRRRGVAVDLLDRPNFVVSGQAYEARFLVRNRGNAPVTLRFDLRSSLGTATLPRDELVLAADESRMMPVQVRTRAGLDAATDDVLEVTASDADSLAAGATASARVTVVPEPDRSIEDYLRVPAQVNLRASSSDAVSRFEAFGQGLIRDGGSTRMNFLVRGPTGEYAAFGERDEYRLSLSAPSWRARAGDHTYVLSSLTTTGQPGFGGSVDASRGAFVAGAYGQQFRRLPQKGSEQGAFVSVTPREGTRLALNAVTRAGGVLAGQLASATANIERPDFQADVEVAGSRDGAARGIARSARLSGSSAGVSYDLGHLAADTGFAGAQRGAQHNYMIARAQPWDAVALGFNGSLHRVDLGGSIGTPYEDRLEGAALSATFFGNLMVEAGQLAHATIVQRQQSTNSQNSLRARGDRQLPIGTMALELEGGRARWAAAPTRDFTDVTLSLRRALSRGRGQLGAYVQRYSGGSVVKGEDGTVTAGGDASLSFRNGMRATLLGYGTRQRRAGAEWNTQLDAMVTRPLASGSSVSLRARLFAGGSMPSAGRSVAYLEYGMPLRLPVSRLRTPGRVYGRIVDATTGQGVGGALVRLGPQVAITDASGDVAFGGVPAGEHRLSMSQATAFTNAVFVDDPTIRVDSTRTSPTTFTVAVAQSARIDIDVRRFVAARTAVAGVQDSLVESGAVSNATIVLAGERDTLYRTTGETGRASFTDVPPGHWTVAVRGDTPAFHRFDPDRMEVDLRPGEARALAFRLVPRRREVQIIGGNQDLKAAPAEPKPQPGATGTRTVKPEDTPRQQQESPSGG